jgi:hypothetical protein
VVSFIALCMLAGVQERICKKGLKLLSSSLGFLCFSYYVFFLFLTCVILFHYLVIVEPDAPFLRGEGIVWKKAIYNHLDFHIKREHNFPGR